MSPEQLRFAATVSQLSFCNPFLPQRIALERDALGASFVETDPVWHFRVETESERPNVALLASRSQECVEAFRESLLHGLSAGEQELTLYEDLVLYLLYYRYHTRLLEIILRMSEHPQENPKVGFWGEFLSEFRHFLEVPGVRFPGSHSPAHLLACYFQLRRAFQHIYNYLVGRSMPVARLRAAVWNSIFSHDLRRYYRGLYQKMGDFTTLITGESGTGKELVARAIGLSRYIPFDPKTQSFTENFARSFHALSISALSPTLIESELFGHRSGSFTGATDDRAGWLEVCPPLGTVFLDEIGDLDVPLQVKLLRALQTRTFQRLGDTQTRHFHGKVIAATNRDLAAEMLAGRFRRDLYYRLCSDMITTPTLREQLADAPGDLPNMILYIARRVAGDSAESVTAEVRDWIEQHVRRDYPWPGNFRELEQCVSNILIHRAYHPAFPDGATPGHDLADVLSKLTLTAEELLSVYCTAIHAQTLNYEETARRLNLDRRTVKSRLDPALLEQLRARAKA
jgi:transcriptional regulator with AAA-type ATPase domain